MWFWLMACNGVDKSDQQNVEDTVLQTGTVRFVAIGDAGEGNDTQYAVADVVETVCSEKGCDFALYLGDNFYDIGVESVDDIQFQEKFEQPYANLDFPFYVVLGNHDYGGAGHLQDKPEPQVEYTAFSNKWNLPARTHAFTQSHIKFYGLDTNALMWSSEWGGYDTQVDWFQAERSSSVQGWNIAFGHHPYISNGSHGVAGQYDGLDGMPIAAGEDIKRFVEEEMCGNIDVYFSGHDHDLQWLEPQCGIEFIVSGAGAKTRSLEGWDVPTRFETDQQSGFVWVEVIDQSMTLQFYGVDGNVLYEGVISK